MPLPLFMTGKDNSQNFVIQEARDGALIRAIHAYPALTLDRLRVLFSTVHPRVLARRTQKLAERSARPRASNGSCSAGVSRSPVKKVAGTSVWQRSGRGRP